MKTKHQTVLSIGQMKELICAVVEGIPTDLPADEAQYWIGRKKQLALEIKKVFHGKVLLGPAPRADLIVEWENFYRDIGIHCDLSGVVIPNDPGGFERVIIMAPGITPQKAYDICAKNFKCWKWTDKDLDKIITSDRPANPYAVRFRNRVEADEELKDVSARQLKGQGIQGITLEERLILELKYFKETDKHLDIQNVTLCSGSRDDDGRVPSVDWGGDDGELRVGWRDPDYSGDGLRSRVAVV